MSDLELWDAEKHHVSRHGRVRADALDMLRITQRWAREHGIEVEVSALGHHWGFHTLDMRHVAEWWPSSGKLVVEGKYRKALYAGDVESVKRELMERWIEVRGRVR